MAKMLDLAKLNRSDTGTVGKLEEQSTAVTDRIQAVIAAIQKLPNAGDISLEAAQDWDKIAEQELIKATKGSFRSTTFSMPHVTSVFSEFVVLTHPKTLILPRPPLPLLSPPPKSSLRPLRS